MATHGCVLRPERDAAHAPVREPIAKARLRIGQSVLDIGPERTLALLDVVEAVRSTVMSPELEDSAPRLQRAAGFRAIAADV